MCTVVLVSPFTTLPPSLTSESLVDEVSKPFPRIVVDGRGHMHQQQLLQLHQRFLIDLQWHKIVMATFHHGFDFPQLVKGCAYLVFHCQREKYNMVYNVLGQVLSFTVRDRNIWYLMFLVFQDLFTTRCRVEYLITCSPPLYRGCKI